MRIMCLRVPKRAHVRPGRVFNPQRRLHAHTRFHTFAPNGGRSVVGARLQGLSPIHTLAQHRPRPPRVDAQGGSPCALRVARVCVLRTSGHGVGER